MHKSKMAVWGGQIAVKRREVKSKGEKERHKHLNAKSSGSWEASLRTKLVEVMEFQLSYFKS